MNPRSRDALCHLLGDMFSVSELRQFLRRGPRGDEIARRLPSDPVSLDVLADETVSMLCHLGLAGPELFSALKEELPERAREIDEVARVWIADPAPTGRGRWYFRLEGSFEQVDVELLSRILEDLRAISHDPRLSIRALGPGSIVIEVEVTARGGEELIRAHREGRLEQLAGLRLRSIDSSPPNSPWRSGFPVPMRLTSRTAQCIWEVRAPPELAWHAGARSRYHGSLAAIAGAGLAMGAGYALELPVDETRALLDVARLSAVLSVTRLIPLLSGPVARVVLPLVLRVDTLAFARAGDELLATVEAVNDPPDPLPYNELPERIRDDLALEDYSRLVEACRPGASAEASLPLSDDGLARTLRVSIVRPRTAADRDT